MELLVLKANENKHKVDFFNSECFFILFKNTWKCSYSETMKMNNVFHFSVKSKDCSENSVKIRVSKRISGRDRSRKAIMRHQSLKTKDVIHLLKNKTRHSIPNYFNSHAFQIHDFTFKKVNCRNLKLCRKPFLFILYWNL